MSTQSQVINLLADLQEQLGLAYLFIAHDLSVVRHISDRIAVMYLGRIVEIGPADEVYVPADATRTPRRCSPRSRSPTRPCNATASASCSQGDIPSPADPPPGCRFHTRCPYAMDVCGDAGPAAVRDRDGHDGVLPPAHHRPRCSRARR